MDVIWENWENIILVSIYWNTNEFYSKKES